MSKHEAHAIIESWARRLRQIDEAVAGDGARTGIEYGFIRDLRRDLEDAAKALNPSK